MAEIKRRGTFSRSRGTAKRPSPKLKPTPQRERFQLVRDVLKFGGFLDSLA